MRRYRHLFFDLDHTLWDFQANSRAVLAELHGELALAERDVPLDEFVPAYEEVNEHLWSRYEAGDIDKSVLRVLRFRNTLLRFGLKDDRLARTLGETYLERCPHRALLIPGAAGLLRDLRPHYELHIITNGFHDVQCTKLRTSGIQQWFGVVLSSEVAGAAKPDERIFRHALRAAGATASESLMIGDNAVADIAGARTAGMDQAHYAPSGGAVEATYRLAHLDELRTVLLHSSGASFSNT